MDNKHKFSCKCSSCHFVPTRKPNAYKFLQAQKAINEHNQQFAPITIITQDYDEEFLFHQT